MLLVIDVGNTNITLGVFDGEELKGTFRMMTRQNRTSDEYGILMCNMLEYRGIHAAKLPKIAIEKPASILAKETITSMQAGLVYGYIGQVEYIIRKVKEESGIEDLKVVATGGLGKIIADETEMIDVYDTQLTLTGLRIIFEKTKKSRG